MTSGGKAETTSPGAGTPPDISAENATVRAIDRATSQLEMHRQYMQRDLDQARAEMRDVRDRLKTVEVKVDALPSKVWIGTVVAAAVSLVSAIVGLIAFLTRH